MVHRTEDDAAEGDGTSSDANEDEEPQDAAASPAAMTAILKLIAETQRDMQKQRKPIGDDLNHRNRTLASVKLPEFSGGHTVSVAAYREFRKEIEIKRKLYDLSSPELTMLLYTQVAGKAKKALRLLKMNDLGKETL